jgi:D-arabinose 1-dehydrogenase-like Zn-dependent alcohol dehydrogenase
VRAVLFEQFRGPLSVRELPDPAPARHGVVVAVAATGLCRSDWHGWQGHDQDIALPHVPGHELAGTVVAAGTDVTGWRAGDRVTVPFVCACGSCPACAAGAQQVCERQTQPGFTHWGSFAELVAIDHADVNLVAVPPELSLATAAGLGCRFATAFRAVRAVGRVAAGEWVVVFGCGGVGLSAIMIAVAAGAQVVAVDVSPAALALARRFGASACVDAGSVADVPGAVADATGGGAHVSMDALGSQDTCAAAIRSLRRHGRHVQIGLLPTDPTVPLGRAISNELSIMGSHGMAAHDYPPMLAMIAAGTLRPDLLVTNTIGLAAAPAALAGMATAPGAGVTIIEPGG